LLGIDWAFQNLAIIDLKKDTMTFEANERYQGGAIVGSILGTKVYGTGGQGFLIELIGTDL